MKSSKLKVKTDKYYPLNQSALYRVNSKKKLAEVLLISGTELATLIRDDDKIKFYNCYLNEKDRLIQQPQGLMYKLHNRVANLLSRIETPEYIQYSKKGLSHITNASIHANSKQVITFDIKSYYLSIKRESVQNFFREELECEIDIAFILSKLCTLDEALPTGSQISNYLCNLVNLVMFDEMNSLASRFGMSFSVYADDITISGDNLNSSHLNTMRKIIERYGYCIKDEKTKIFKGNETAVVTGIALKESLDIKNEFYSDLRKLCELVNSYIDKESYAQLKGDYFKLKGKIQYIKQLNQTIPRLALNTKALLERKLDGQI